MGCCFRNFYPSNNCCSNNCCNGYRTIMVGPPGPMGPQGPRGYTGATGASGLSNGIYARASGTFATGAIIPLVQAGITPNSTLTLSNNTINVPAGTFLVSYGADGTTDANTDPIQTALYQNGTELVNETVSSYNNETTSANGSRTSIITFTTAGTLSLYNITGSSVTYQNAYLTVVQLA